MGFCTGDLGTSIGEFGICRMMSRHGSNAVFLFVTRLTFFWLVLFLVLSGMQVGKNVFVVPLFVTAFGGWEVVFIPE